MIKLTQCHKENGYSFYIGTKTEENGCTVTIFNIVPSDQPAPTGGYPNRQYIEKLKGIKFPDRYQPTKNGMRELYPNG